MTTGLELLTTEEMARADQLAVAAGVPSLTLMENAGRAVADEAEKMVKPGARIAVLCGPGNNGGDGFVAGRLLRERGYEVRVVLLGSRVALKGDAGAMAGQWTGAVEVPSAHSVAGAALIIDALFGAGLARQLDGTAAELVESSNASGIQVLAVDVPSGLDGTTGATVGPVIRAVRTVTFFRRKPGHLLMPGRALCGETVVAEIGIPGRALVQLGPNSIANAPALWHGHFPWPGLDVHKYIRGHGVVVSGPADSTGAARLGARGALRIGAGLVTVVGSAAATAVNATHLTAIMVRAIGGDRVLSEFLADERRNAVLFGPGASIGPETAETTLAILGSNAAVVLDADALTSFAQIVERGSESAGFGFTGARKVQGLDQGTLFGAIRNRSASVVMTPHEGEFKRLFPAITHASKLERAREAARISGAIVVLKGPDTVIAAPDGRAAINDNAPPWLATAGSGDVLAGFITGLLAQKMPAFEAACAAVWLHGECASVFGPGLIAEDLPESLPEILGNLHHAAGRPGWDPSKSNGG